MENDMIIKEFLKQNGFNSIQNNDSHFTFQNGNGNLTIKITDKFVSGRWEQVDNFKDVMFFEPQHLSNLLQWIVFYSNGGKFNVRGTIGYINDDV